MEKQFKPPGYNSLSPYFIVSDPAKWIQLLKDVFGAEEMRRYDNPDGTLMHAEVKIDDSILMVSQASDAYPVNQLLIHVYVEDAISTFRKAIQAGCGSIEEPVKKDTDPDLRGQFRDFEGNVWAIGTQQQNG